MSSEEPVTVEVDRLRISAVVRQGSGAGVPLVVCNGLGALQGVLKPFTDALDERITVIRFDAPGVGGSSVPRLPLSFRSLSRIVTRMVSELGHDRFDILGVSWGGALAQQVAFQNPLRLRRMVLVSAIPGWIGVPGKLQATRHLMTPWRYVDPAHARSVAGDVYGGDVRAHPELADPVLYDHANPPSGRGYLWQLAATAGWTSVPVLPAIRQHTLVMNGTDDPVVPVANARMIARLLPHARLHTYDDGHLALLTRPRELAPVVSHFLLEP